MSYELLLLIVITVGFTVRALWASAALHRHAGWLVAAWQGPSRRPAGRARFWSVRQALSGRSVTRMALISGLPLVATNRTLSTPSVTVTV